MKIHSYTYKGKTVNVYKASLEDILKKTKYKNYIEFIEGGITTKVYIKGLDINDQQYSLTVHYFFKKFVGDTLVFESEPSYKKVENNYSMFYGVNVEGMLGSFIRYGQLNTIAIATDFMTGKNFIGDQALPFNPIKNYSPMQPLSYVLDTTETGVAVRMVDYSADYNIEYTLDGENYKNLIDGEEIPLEPGVYSIAVRAKEEMYPFPSDFVIAAPIEEI